ncbi:MAG TPA: PAS domain-containing protein [Rhizomicrobium sp.]|jgi:PAS domain-containing protein|nr:PAS domain-containing protein [Rhizomicrobium sp.]
MTLPLHDTTRTTGDSPDYAALFDKTPGLYVVLDTSFAIVAANDAYCAATMTIRADIVGRPLFQVFPDNPGDSAADGVHNLRTSLLKVLKTRAPDRMAIQKYDIERRGIGGFEVRYWSAFNIPILGPDGYVKWIIHTVADVTELAADRHNELRETLRTQARG